MKLAVPVNYRSAVNFGDWTLYHLPVSPTGSFLWQPFKLMLPPSAPGRWGQKRAYRLAWSPLEQRFAADGVTTALQRAQPTLAAQVELHMSLTYGPDWLTGPGFYDPEEVEAEQARLRAGRLRRAAEARAVARR